MERVKEVRARLNGFRTEHQDMASQWHGLTAIMTKKRAESLKDEAKEKKEITKV